MGWNLDEPRAGPFINRNLDWVPDKVIGYPFATVPMDDPSCKN